MSIKPISENFRKDYQDFSGGLNTRNSQLVIPANQFAQLDNCVVNDKQLLEKAKGYTNANSPFPDSSSSFIRMLVNFRRGSVSEKLVCAALDASNTNATYQVDLKESAGDGTWSYIGYNIGKASFVSGSKTVTGSSGTLWLANIKPGDKIQATSGSWYEVGSVTTNTSLELTINFAQSSTGAVDYLARPVLHKSSIPRAVTFNNNLVIVDGNVTPLSYNGTCVYNVPAAYSPQPQFKFIEVHKNRVFAADADNIYWSAVDDETSWLEVAQEPVFTQSGGSICGIKSFGDSLVVLKDNGRVFQVFGSFDQTAEGSPAFIRALDMPENMGVIAGYTAVVHDDARLYFLSESGVYSIGSSMDLKKESLSVIPEIQNLVLKSSVTGTNSFQFDTKPQWDLGTHNGTRATSSGELVTYGDHTNLSNISRHIAGDGNDIAGNNTNCVIATDGKVYAPFIESSGRYLKCTIWDTDGTTTTETVADTRSLPVGYTPYNTNTFFGSLKCAISSSNKIGVAISRITDNGSGYTYEVIFMERVAGTWTITLAATTSGLHFVDAFIYNSGEDPRLVLAPSTRTSMGYYRRVAGVWTSSAISMYATSAYGCSMVFTSTSHVSLFVNYHTDFIHQISADDGASWSSDETIVVAGGEWGRKGQIVLDNIGDIKVAYSTYTTSTGYPARIVHRNLTRNVSTTISTSTEEELGGYQYVNYGDLFFIIKGPRGVDAAYEYFVIDAAHTIGSSATFANGNATVTGSNTKWLTFLSVGDRIKLLTDDETKYGTILSIETDTSLTLTATYTGSSSTGNYVSVHRKTVFGSDVGASGVTTAYTEQYRQPSLTSYGTLVVSEAPNSSDGMSIRRISFNPTWTSPEEHDSTLSEWGTYIVTDEIKPNSTIVYQSAVDTATMANPDYSTIIPPVKVSSESSKTYFKTKISFNVSGFSSCSIGKLTVNFTGAGVDAKIPTAVAYDNEIYFAATQTGESANNKELLLDRGHVWSTHFYPVTFMTRFLGNLWGGSSLNGDVFCLRSGYNYDGSAYTATALFKEDLLGSLELEKDIYKVYVVFEKQSTGTFTLSYRTNNYRTVGGSDWTSQVINSTGEGMAEVLIGQRASSLQFKISNSGSNERMGIIGLIVLYGFLNLR